MIPFPFPPIPPKWQLITGGIVLALIVVSIFFGVAKLFSFFFL